MKTYTMPPDDDPPRAPDTANDRTDRPEVVPRSAEADDRVPEEQGYGYGV